MKKLSIVFVAALSLAAFGCKKKGGDCAKAITNSMELSKADMAKMPGINDKMMEKMKDLGMQHCRDDKWSEDAVKCMSDAKTETEAQSCYGKMSSDQKDKMSKAMMEMMTPPGGGAAGAEGAGASAGSAGSGMAAGSAGAAMGSDTGAAGAGSAGMGSAPAGAAETGSGSAGSAAAPK